jgi:ATP-binding cassette subfamily F protein uup
LADASLYSGNPKRFAELTGLVDAARIEKHATEERWLELAMMVEEMNG